MDGASVYVRLCDGRRDEEIVPSSDINKMVNYVEVLFYRYEYNMEYQFSTKKIEDSVKSNEISNRN